MQLQNIILQGFSNCDPNIIIPRNRWKNSMMWMVPWKVDLNMFLRQPDYWSVFQTKVMAIYVANGVLFIRISISSDIQAALRSLSGVMNNSRNVSEFRLQYPTGLCNNSENCRTDNLTKAHTLLLECFPIDFDILLTSVNLAIVRKFFQDSYSTVRVTWP